MSNIAAQNDCLPIIGLCGSSGAGKTTLIEALVPKFINLGLRVAVVKHGAHRVVVDAPGKDSERFFQAGADVALFGEEFFIRRHDTNGFLFFLRRLGMDYDLVLVEGHASTPVNKIWLLGKGHGCPPENAGTVLHIIEPSQRRVEAIFNWIADWLTRQWRRVPVYGCLLIGGRSSRMGRPKHLIDQDGRTWLEDAVAKLETHVDQVVLSGRGEVPASLARLVRVPDVPGLAGPLAGLLSVLRWQPAVSWLMVACDQPTIDPRAFSWLKSLRKPGVRAILPDLHGDGRVEPLLAWYDFRCRPLVEELTAGGCLRPGGLVGRPGIITPRPPADLHGSWRNINTPDELNSLLKREKSDRPDKGTWK